MNDDGNMLCSVADSLPARLDIRSWGRIAPLFSAMSAPTRRNHSNGLATRLTIVGLVAGLIALGALVACPTEEDESKSSDANLSALTLSDGMTDVPLIQDALGYDAIVATSVESVTVAATPTVGAATVSIMPTDADIATDGHQVSLQVGDTDITIVVTAEDGSTMRTYTITVNRAAANASSDATLTALTLSDGTTDIPLMQDFASDTLEYTASVGNSVEIVTVTATPTDGTARTTIMLTDADTATDGHQVSLQAGGDTDITIVVTAEDGTTTRTYTITVNRAAVGASSDETLSALTLSDGTLSPTFSSDTTSYTATVADSIESVTVTATPTDNGARTTITPADADTATDGHQVSLQAGGDTPIAIVVTAEDGTTTRTYTITVTRSDTTAPTFTAVPSDTTTGVTVDATIVITANEPIRMTDGAEITNDTEITNGTVAGLITLMETPSGSSTAAVKLFTATIDAAKRILTIDPTDDFANGSSVSVSLAQVEDAAGNDSADPAIEATFTVVPMTIDIRTRTQAVQDAIVATSEVTATDRAAIPSPQLAAITSLTVSGLSSLMADDFANLSGLTTLNLGGNSGLTTLPSGILDDLLDTLTTLTLDTALQGTVDFSTASGDIEQGATVALSVTLTTALPTAVQIPYAVTFGGAGPADAADFSGLADGMVTFAAGSMAAQSISVTTTATANVGGTATLTLGTPILTADTRTSDRLDSSSLVSVGSTASHTLTVVGEPGATLSVTDDSVTEEAADGTPGRAAVFTLALTNLPTDGVDDVSVFFTMSGFAGTIGSDRDRVTRLFTFATTTDSNVSIGPRDLGETTGAGRIELSQPNIDGDIAVDGRSTAIFQLMLQNDDGNDVDETITLTINCVARFARSRTGAGEQGCTSAGAGNTLVAGSAVEGNGAEITVTDDEDPMATLSVTDGSVTEEAASGTPGREAKIKLALTNLPTSGADDVSIFYTVAGFAGDIGNSSTYVTRFGAIASTTSAAVNIMPRTDATTGVGRVAINRADGGSTADMDIDDDGSATVEFLIRLQKDDGNLDDETITLTINCVARNRSGLGETGCTNAGAGNILVAQGAVGGNGASVIGDDDVPFERLPEQDFTTLDARNTILRGLWSKDTTMWVVNFSAAKIFAYNLTSKVRDFSKDFNTLNAASNTAPFGLWSNDTTMWVANRLQNSLGLFAYGLTSKSRDDSKDFTTLFAAGNLNPSGIWSNGITMWVADDETDTIFAYRLTSKSRDDSKDFTTLFAAGNHVPTDIWSNGRTMWVADDRTDTIFAYNLISKVRDSSMEFDTLDAAGNRNPTGLWSDGKTMWVADSAEDKIFAYRMPPTE